MQNSTDGGFWDRLRTWFPEREFFMRSQGQVRFITITSRVQMVAAGLALIAILGWAASVGGAAFSQYRASAERTSLLEREAHVAQSEERFGAYADDIAATTAQLEQRQDFIEGVVGSLPEEFLSGEEDTVSDSASESEELISMIREVFPQAVGLAQIEARQIAFVEGLTRYADRRAARAEQAMRTLGVDPRTVVNANQDAMGGPLESLFSEADGSIDPRFERLGLSLARMSALERGLDSIPQVMPADINSISSGFGFRRDPFTGGGAMHSGLDFRAPHGAPIHAAAAGTVTFSGWRSGYGQTVEITHGSGMVTRYAHMSRFSTRAGAEVAAGEVIGAIGSTGRSTGPHLHFEVRINGRAVNPRPFLETAPHVLEEARAEFAPNANTSGSTNDG
ncbi:peptidoglycan DD-metalloendopeptidase family protein [Aurantiacibacter marinus]|uniref:Peptidase M23 n=1 Tax=Aurantiacibacter marinus TaxID=874156 RepID=A0A0H0XWS1_9SPHN|nr:peptidoglycan DD-metalloendopeptidase family protein [Aurantiacibacter marinus]KLI64770.1 peptidase M23 [Aurantiacibacter marinus]